MVNLPSLIAANTILILATLVTSSLPLYFAVRLVKGETGIVKAISISLILSFASAAAFNFIGPVAGLLMLIGTIFVYQIAFRVSFPRALLAWILQNAFVAITVFALVYLVGVSL